MVKHIVIVRRLHCVCHVEKLVVVLLLLNLLRLVVENSFKLAGLQPARGCHLSVLLGWPDVHATVTRSKMAMHCGVVIQVDELAGQVVVPTIIEEGTLSEHLNRFVSPCKTGLLKWHCWQETVRVLAHGGRSLISVLLD